MDEKKKLQVPFVLWILSLSIGVLYFGLGGLLNIPRWILAFIEALEFLFFAPQNPSAISAIFIPTNESILSWMGLSYFAAAGAALWTLLKSEVANSKKVALSVLGITPIIPIVALGYHLRESFE